MNWNEFFICWLEIYNAVCQTNIFHITKIKGIWFCISDIHKNIIYIHIVWVYVEWNILNASIISSDGDFSIQINGYNIFRIVSTIII